MGLPAGLMSQENRAGVKPHQDWEVELPQIRATVYYWDFQTKTQVLS